MSLCLHLICFPPNISLGNTNSFCRWTHQVCGIVVGVESFLPWRRSGERPQSRTHTHTPHVGWFPGHSLAAKIFQRQYWKPRWAERKGGWTGNCSAGAPFLLNSVGHDHRLFPKAHSPLPETVLISRALQGFFYILTISWDVTLIFHSLYCLLTEHDSLVE